MVDGSVVNDEIREDANATIVPVPPAPLVYWPYVMLAFLAVGVGILVAQRNRVVKRDAEWEDRQVAAQAEGMEA